MVGEVERNRFDLNTLAHENKKLKKELSAKNGMIKSLFEKYIENKDFKVSAEENNFEKMIGLIEDRLKKSHSIIQTEMNKRILDKFDQLRDYYRVNFHNAL